MLGGCKILVERCAKLQIDDSALILYDERTEEISRLLEKVVIERCKKTMIMEVVGIEIHGQEPPQKIVEAMLESTVIFCLTSFSLAHTQARINTAKKGTKFLSLPQYNPRVLGGPELDADYENQTKLTNSIAECFSSGSIVELRSDKGTNLRMKIDGRSGNSYPGWCDGPGSLASPPDIEANIAPVELESNGVVIVNGSIAIPEIGLLKQPTTLKLENGRIIEFSGRYSSKLRHLFNELGTGADILGELGVGLNTKAKLSGNMLIDEGVWGTVHLGFGSNKTIGGKNIVNSHIDMIITDVDLLVDNHPIIISGSIVLENK